MQLKKIVLIITVLGFFSCSEINRQSAPVEIVVSVSQKSTIFDIINPPIAGDINIQFTSIVKRTDVANTRFLDVVLDRIVISYSRNDGGTQVPATFSRRVSILLTAGGTADPGVIQIFDLGASGQAPIAALFPNNGGLDPVTRQPFVALNVIVTVFGETLSGEEVSGRGSFPLNVCVGCRPAV